MPDTKFSHQSDIQRHQLYAPAMSTVLGLLSADELEQLRVTSAKGLVRLLDDDEKLRPAVFPPQPWFEGLLAVTGLTAQDLEPLPDELPGGSPAAATEGDPQRPAAEGNFDELAWYQPFHGQPSAAVCDAGPAPWGLYLPTGGIERLAREAFVPAGLGLEQSLAAAAAALTCHELFHHCVETAVTTVELWDYAAPLDLYAQHPPCPGSATGWCELEEGAANAFAVVHAQPGIVKDTLVAHLRAHAPVGYRAFGDKLGDAQQTHVTARSLLGHYAGNDLPRFAELLLDVSGTRVTPWHVPFHLLQTPGSAHARGLWTFAGV